MIIETWLIPSITALSVLLGATIPQLIGLRKSKIEADLKLKQGYRNRVIKAYSAIFLSLNSKKTTIQQKKKVIHLHSLTHTYSTEGLWLGEIDDDLKKLIDILSEIGEDNGIADTSEIIDEIEKLMKVCQKRINSLY